MPTKFRSPQTIDSLRTPTKPQDRAVLAVASWADACGIKWQQSSDSDLLLFDTGGKPVDLLIEPVVGGSPNYTNSMLVSGEALTCGEKERALGAFHSLTERLGYGKPDPIDRGEEPDSKLCYKDNMELVALRHGLLRLAPNLTPEQIAPYASVIERCTEKYHNKFRRFFDLFGYLLSDLQTFTNMWFLIWHHHYRKLFGTLDENQKLLTRYIQQSFINFGSTIQSKANGCFPEGESVTVALYEDFLGKPLPTFYKEDAPGVVPLPFTVEHDYNKPPDAAEDADYQQRHTLLDKSSEAKRRKSAAAILADLLSKLPHDKMVSLLTEASENKAHGYDARSEARKQLRKHQDSCSVCQIEKDSMASEGE